MEQLLVWIALAAGGMGLAGALVRGRGAALPNGSARVLLAGGLGLVGVALLLSLLTMPPFSPGQTLAPGLALGAATALLGALVSRVPLSGPLAPAVVGSGRFGAATCGVALLSVPFAGNPLDALMGFGVGAAVTALVVAGGLELLGEAPEDAPLAVGAETTALLAVTLAAATYLATYHRGPTGLREWQPLPVLFTGAGALLLMVRGIVSATPGREGWYSLLVPVVPLGIVAWLVAQQLHGTAGFLQAVLAGFGVFALVSWLERSSTGTDVSAGQSTAGTGLVTALLVLGGAVLAFRELHGYGLALMVLAGFVVVAALEPTGAAPRKGGLTTGALLLGLVVVLYRMYEERNEYARGFRPDFLYYYVALVAGAVLPAALTEASSRGLTSATHTGTRPGSALARLLTVLGASLLAPLAVWLLLGDRPQSALLVGVAVGAAGLWGFGRAIPRLSGTLMLLSAVQLTHLLTPLALRTRGQRLAILAAVALAVVLPLLVAAWRERSAPGTVATGRV